MLAFRLVRNQPFANCQNRKPGLVCFALIIVLSFRPQHPSKNPPAPIIIIGRLGLSLSGATVLFLTLFSYHIKQRGFLLRWYFLWVSRFQPVVINCIFRSVSGRSWSTHASRLRCLSSSRPFSSPRWTTVSRSCVPGSWATCTRLKCSTEHFISAKIQRVASSMIWSSRSCSGWRRRRMLKNGWLVCVWLVRCPVTLLLFVAGLSVVVVCSFAVFRCVVSWSCLITAWPHVNIKTFSDSHRFMISNDTHVIVGISL